MEQHHNFFGIRKVWIEVLQEQPLDGQYLWLARRASPLYILSRGKQQFFGIELITSSLFLLQ
jgi:hypothetical protein